MTLVAGTIIDTARGIHPTFDLTRSPNKVVLAWLSAYVRELHGKVARIDPEALRADTSAALPLAVHASGIALPSNRHVVEVVAFDAAGKEYPINLIPATHRLDRTTKAASAWQVGSTLYLTSPADLWGRMAQIVVAHVPIPATLTTLTGATGTIALPDTAEMVLIAKLAQFMAGRVSKPDADAANLDLGYHVQYAAGCESAFLDDIANRLTGQMIQTRDVYDP